MTTVAPNPIDGKPLPPEKDHLQTIDVYDILDDYYDEPEEEKALAEKANGLSLSQEAHRPSMPRRPNTLPLIPNHSEPPSITQTNESIPEVPSATGKSFWKTAVDETIHFAGGLVSHPFEATKHYSILRHSSGLIFYKGASTRVTITVFADASLPPDRSFWLQRKGYSGNMGMNAATLFGASGNWTDVTPANEAIVSEMPESDERAWQRDMKKFVKKAAKHKNLSKHVARETCVIRIPASASDGYLRIVMCTGESRKKVLCPSPVFRIASTSSDVSVFRGASLSTMPLEAGLKVASVVGNTVVNRYVGPVRALVDSRVQKVTDKVKPGFVAQRAEHIAYAKSGLRSQFDKFEQNFDGARDVSYDPLHSSAMLESTLEVVGADSGPEQPFPIKTDGTVVQSTGQSQTQLGIPTANLSGLSSDLLLRLSGVYIGWARIEPKAGLEGTSHEWHEAIIAIGPSPFATPRVVAKNVATVHIIHDFGGATFFGAKLKLVLMAYLRPTLQNDRLRPLADRLAEAGNDMDIAVGSLSRENWGPEMTIQRLKTEKSSRSLNERYVAARTQFQKRVDSIPLHLAGVRTAGAEIMDKAHGRGGYFIRR